MSKRRTTLVFHENDVLTLNETYRLKKLTHEVEKNCSIYSAIHRVFKSYPLFPYLFGLTDEVNYFKEKKHRNSKSFYNLNLKLLLEVYSKGNLRDTLI